MGLMRTITCQNCATGFEWQPVRYAGAPPRYCSDYCRQRAKLLSQRKSRERAREADPQLWRRWSTPDRDRRSHLKWAYGLTLEGLLALRQKQDGRCAICLIEFGDTQHTKECVDHDHKTGKIRGLLCHKCNLGLGKFNDDVVLVGSAYAYLTEDRG